MPDGSGPFHLPLTAERLAGREGGYTLVEMAVTVAIMGVVLAITGPVVAMFYNQSTDVQQTYGASNEVILASESLTQYLHDAVIPGQVTPCPGSSSPCTPTQPYYSNLPSSPTTSACTPGGSEQPCSTLLTFYANTGNSAGPAQVVFSVSGTTLTGTITQPNAGTCPVTGTTGVTCTYSSSKSRPLVKVQNLILCSGSTTTACPLSYLVNGGSSCNSAIANPSYAQYGSGITAVCINLQTQNKGGEPVGYQTLAYPLVRPPTFNGSVG